MRYRQLDANGDMVFGHGGADYFVDIPATVAQAILTGLRLFQGEWYLDTTAGVPWVTEVLGKNTGALYDQVLRTQILNTLGVNSIITYSSTLTNANRNLLVEVAADTIYGPVTVSTVL